MINPLHQEFKIVTIAADPSPFDFEGGPSSYDLVIEAKDFNGNTSKKGVTINIDNVVNDEAPSIIRANLLLDDDETEIDLTEKHLKFYDLDTTAADQITYTISAIPLGITITGGTAGGTPENPTIFFTHQDVLDGNITLTITDKDQITGMTLVVTDAQGNSNGVVYDFTPQFKTGNNVIDLSKTTTAEDIRGQEGHDRITPGRGDDTVDGGEGDDRIDLSAGGNDTVVYGAGNKGTLYALGGADVIDGFQRGHDVFVIRVFDQDDTAPVDLAAFFAAVDGDNPDALDANDRLTVTVKFGKVIANGQSIDAVTGVVLNFSEGFVSASGLISMPSVTINFDEGLTVAEFLTLIGGIENFDAPNLALKKVSDLEKLLGENVPGENVPGENVPGPGSLTYDLVEVGINVTSAPTGI